MGRAFPEMRRYPRIPRCCAQGSCFVSSHEGCWLLQPPVRNASGPFFTYAKMTRVVARIVSLTYVGERIISVGCGHVSVGMVQSRSDERVYLSASDRDFCQPLVGRLFAL